MASPSCRVAFRCNAPQPLPETMHFTCEMYRKSEYDYVYAMYRIEIVKATLSFSKDKIYNFSQIFEK